MKRRVELDEQDESEDESEDESDEEPLEEPSPQERSATTKRSPENEPEGGRIAKGRKENLEDDLNVTDTFQAERTR